MNNFAIKQKQGLYCPSYEHDSCGVGFAVNIKGKKTHSLIEKGIDILVNLTHRGAAGSDEDTGDGAGLLIQIPHDFFVSYFQKKKIILPAIGAYAAAMIFLPRGKKEQDMSLAIIKKILKKEGLKIICRRDVPVNEKKIGRLARKTMPAIKQFFVTAASVKNLESKVYTARKLIEREILQSALKQKEMFYICSFSTRTIVYKGLLLATQIRDFYIDLSSPDMKSAIALVHQRYSTNTFPSWALAQPFRLLAHNGEINTLKGNINRMSSREKILFSKKYKKDLKKLLPVIAEGGSDSMALDNMLEFLSFTGRELPHSMMMLIPEAWGVKYPMAADKRGFYEFHSILMEPWDGPAAVAWTDGKIVGANLDRNGLRPARYIVTDDDMAVLASEAGVLDAPDTKIKYRGRLQPGKMLFIDTEQKRIIDDKEIKSKISRRRPYRRWIEENKIELGQIIDTAGDTHLSENQTLKFQRLFGYTYEDIHKIILPMAKTGKEPVGSMGYDAPLAVLSKRPQLLFNYFKQLFAQVTNPAIDSIREELVMSLMSYIGKTRNILEESPRQARLLKLKSPIVTNRALRALLNSSQRNFKGIKIDIVFREDKGKLKLAGAVDKITARVEKAVNDGYDLIVLSDRLADEKNIPVPSLLAVSAVHNHLIKKGLRNKVALVIETGEAREVTHFALLIGYGVSAVNPYMLFETVINLKQNSFLNEVVDISAALENTIHALEKGLLKIFAKMGISTIRSYRGAQIFEALGLSAKFIGKYFPGTISRISGVDIDVIAEEIFKRHKRAFAPRLPFDALKIERGGEYHYRKNEENHLWTPETINLLQRAVRENDYDKYKKYSSLINERASDLITLRGMFDFKKRKRIPLSRVESEKNIIKRFVTGAMSFGSLSKEVHETIAVAMNRLGAMSNSGEGGEDPKRFIPLPNGDLKRSAIKQVASGRFGVSINYLVNAKEIQIKIAQGAKPGEGGQLPGHKVDNDIARVRNTTPGITLISPPPHHDIYSIEDLAQLIYDLKNANPSARVSVKLVSEAGVGTIAAGVAKAKADVIVISGFDGGTGASPLSSLRHAGLPWELGLSEVQQTLIINGLREKTRIQTDGQLRTGKDVVIAAMLGADEFGFGTAPLVTLGCVMMRKCHLNTCPMGVATQDKELRKRFKGKPEHLINYFKFTAREIREIMAELGITKFSGLIGNTDLIRVKKTNNIKTRKIDFKAILHKPRTNLKRYNIKKQEHKINEAFDNKIIKDALPLLNQNKKVKLSYDIRNIDRSAGVLLSSKLTELYGEKGLSEDKLTCSFKGIAGQSFGAFLTRGVTFKIFGAVNDYCGKGLSGGKIIVRPQENYNFKPHKNIIAGNTILYGAIRGEAYFNGGAGERFAVRNSGAVAVVESVGDHGCEYMTGGVVVVLGETGVNFAAGMSGGIVYALDEKNMFDTFCNLSMIDIEPVYSKKDEEELKRLIKNHYNYTGSPKAEKILSNWRDYLPYFVKVIPLEYRKVMGLMIKDDKETKREALQIG